MIKKVIHLVEVINDGCFYVKGSVLIKHSDGKFAPSIENYPNHCHFLTEEFIMSKPKIFKVLW